MQQYLTFNPIEAESMDASAAIRALSVQISRLEHQLADSERRRIHAEAQSRTLDPVERIAEGIRQPQRIQVKFYAAEINPLSQLSLGVTEIEIEQLIREDWIIAHEGYTQIGADTYYIARLEREVFEEVAVPPSVAYVTLEDFPIQATEMDESEFERDENAIDDVTDEDEDAPAGNPIPLPQEWPQPVREPITEPVAEPAAASITPDDESDIPDSKKATKELPRVDVSDADEDDTSELPATPGVRKVGASMVILPPEIRNKTVWDKDRFSDLASPSPARQVNARRRFLDPAEFPIAAEIQRDGLEAYNRREQADMLAEVARRANERAAARPEPTYTRIPGDPTSVISKEELFAGSRFPALLAG